MTYRPCRQGRGVRVRPACCPVLGAVGGRLACRCRGRWALLGGLDRQLHVIVCSIQKGWYVIFAFAFVKEIDKANFCDEIAWTDACRVTSLSASSCHDTKTVLWPRDTEPVRLALSKNHPTKLDIRI